jgi:hypothetical protein
MWRAANGVLVPRSPPLGCSRIPCSRHSQECGTSNPAFLRTRLRSLDPPPSILDPRFQTKGLVKQGSFVSDFVLRISNLPRRGVTHAQWDESPQLPISKKVMTEIIRPAPFRGGTNLQFAWNRGLSAISGNRLLPNLGRPSASSLESSRSLWKDKSGSPRRSIT